MGCSAENLMMPKVENSEWKGKTLTLTDYKILVQEQHFLPLM